MFLPESIDLGHPEKYILSIRLKPNGFMFSIHEPGFEQNYCLRETTFTTKENMLADIQRIIFDLNFLTQEFRQTNVIFVSADYEMVPAKYFRAKDKDMLYNLTHANKAKNTLYSLADGQDIVTLYNADRDIYEFLSRNLWNPQFTHHTSLVGIYLDKQDEMINKGSKMYLNFHDRFMDVFCYSGTKLVHCITFEDEPAINQLYFILKLWEACGFDQMNDYLYVIGEPDMKLMLQIQEYINKIERLPAPREASMWNEDAQKAPLDLLSLAL